MGIDTRIFSTDTFPVPNTWVFEKFLNLEEKLAGQSIRKNHDRMKIEKEGGLDEIQDNYRS